MLQALCVLHQFRKRASLLLAFEARGKILPLQVSDLGDDHYLIGRQLDTVHQTCQHLPHQAFRAPVGVIGACID